MFPLEAVLAHRDAVAGLGRDRGDLECAAVELDLADIGFARLLGGRS
jgi:hypothetical protein